MQFKFISLSILLVVLSVSVVVAKPLKVYILAGQSNMQGHARTKTFQHMKQIPELKSMYQKICKEDGTPRTFNNIYITTSGVQRTKTQGPLTAKYGGDRAGPKIGC